MLNRCCPVAARWLDEEECHCEDAATAEAMINALRKVKRILLKFLHSPKNTKNFHQFHRMRPKMVAKTAVAVADTIATTTAVEVYAETEFGPGSGGGDRDMLL